MMRTHRYGRGMRTGTVMLAVASAIALTGCSSSLNEGGDAASGGSDCGTVNLAMNDWVGYTADAAVYTYLAENELGCTVEQKSISEQVAWQGFPTGEVDVILENWGHEDLAEQYIDQQQVAVDLGETGNEGVIGWYVPPWMAEQYPDILDWNNLNKYADLFKTSESGDQGQLLDGDPSFVTNDAALVKNLGLNFKVVYSGSETALIEAFRKAEQDKTPLLGYFYEPHWFFSEIELKKVDLPAYTDGCDADAEKVACDYPDYNLNKIARKEWVDAGSPAVDLLKNFKWTNDDQNEVAKAISDGTSPEDAAKAWIDANPDKVNAMLGK